MLVQVLHSTECDCPSNVHQPGVATCVRQVFLMDARVGRMQCKHDVLGGLCAIVHETMRGAWESHGISFGS